MKFTLPVKFLSVSAVVLSCVVGCASQTKPVAEAPAPAAPSAATAQALADAQAAVKAANDLDWIWRDTEETLKKAEEAAKAGDDAAALKGAKKAKAEAVNAVNQYYIEKAKPMLAALQAKRKLTAAQKELVSSAEAAIRAAEGKKAYEMLSKP
ncbi:MAG: hypothetical protein KKE76_10685 [Gammaproteobacteria bacterium]|nr:hypothetical protein [Gammaproteobacteria bacterium]